MALSQEVQEIAVLGLRVHCVDVEETIRLIEEFISSNRPHLLVTLSTEMVVYAQKDLEFRELVNAASLVVPDASGILWAAEALHGIVLKKVSGIDLIQKIAQVAATKGWRIFFLGSAEGVAGVASARLKKSYPGLIVAGTHHGYFKNDAEVASGIRTSRPQILLVALGSPRQEKWFWERKDELGVPVGIGVGGSFDVLAGRVRRAPAFMVNLGLEWLYRLLQEPKRFRRMLALPRFVYLVQREKWRARKRLVS